MTRKEKLINRLLRKPRDFTYSELEKPLSNFGYEEINTGKTAGSRRAFIKKETNHIIRLHKPHPKPVLKLYQVEYIINELNKEKLI